MERVGSRRPGRAAAESSPEVPPACDGDSASSSLSPQEDYMRPVRRSARGTYKGQWTDVDLTGSLEPPRDLFIDVRVLKDAGARFRPKYG